MRFSELLKQLLFENSDPLLLRNMSKTKVVDNFNTQLKELYESLCQLEQTMAQELTKLGSEFDEINTILIDGFRNVLDKKPPIDVIPDAYSLSDEEFSDEDGSGEDEETDNSGSRPTQVPENNSAQQIMQMLKCMSGQED